ncbi:MAG: AI-2E family transporter [Patescibacteria group bacterium]
MTRDGVFNISSASVVKLVLIPFFFFILFQLRGLLFVVLTAVVFASAVEPMARWFISFRIPRLVAVLIIYIAFASLFVFSFYALFVPVLNETSGLLSTLSEYVATSSGDSSVSSFLSSNPAVQQLSTSFSLQEVAYQINLLISNISGGLFATVSIVSGGLLSFLLIIVLSFYLAVQENGIPVFLTLISPIHQRGYVINLWHRAEHKIGLWMQGQLILVILVAILVYLGLTLLGVENALLLALLAGIFEIIPIFGPILSAIPAIVIGFSGGGVSLALLVLGLYVIIQQFENHLIYPLVVKKVVGVPSTVVILALVAGAQLAGFLGMLLSVPLAAIMMEFLTDVQKGNIPQEGKEL